MPLKPLKPLPSSLLKHDHTVLAPRISDHSSACTGCRHTKKGGIRCTQTSTKAEVVDINSCGTTAASDAAMKSPCPRVAGDAAPEIQGTIVEIRGTNIEKVTYVQDYLFRHPRTIFPQCGHIFRIRSQPNGR